MEIDVQGSKRRYGLAFAMLGIALWVLILLNICIGSVTVPFSELVSILINPREGDVSTDILWKIRLPRLLAGVFLGGALALSGFLLQTFFNNPIAGPYVLGISHGAKLAVALIMVFVMGTSYKPVSSATLILAAFVGAMISMGFILLISQKVQQASLLIVGGVMIGYICSAITDFIVTFAEDASIVNLHNWSRGSFSGISWEDVELMAVVVMLTSLGVFFLSKPIAAYQLGESYAQNMGVNIKTFRLLLVLLSSVLAACVTAFAGPISFVGIAVPHLAKALMKTSKPLVIIPACFLVGAIFCLGCDLIARTAFSPLELGISSVTALFGAPVVIFIMIRRRMRD